MIDKDYFHTRAKVRNLNDDSNYILDRVYACHDGNLIMWKQSISPLSHHPMTRLNIHAWIVAHAPNPCAPSSPAHVSNVPQTSCRGYLTPCLPHPAPPMSHSTSCEVPDSLFAPCRRIRPCLTSRCSHSTSWRGTYPCLPHPAPVYLTCPTYFL